MHIGHHYRLWQTLLWSRMNFFIPLAWSAAVCTAYAVFEFSWMSVPWLPMSLIGIAVAFYLGFKNNASYDRMWEARKIWGAIVNASRSWAYSARDLVSTVHGGEVADSELQAIRQRLVLRHVAWLDSMRFQLRKIQTWEHQGAGFDALRKQTGVPELSEDMAAEVSRNLTPEEAEEVLAQINPAARLLANQSRELAQLRSRGLLDGFGHMELQRVLRELMAQQGKAERIKNFPFPRQYATINGLFAMLLVALIPFGMIEEFNEVGGGLVWLSIPFSAIVSWVFLTADQIGEWSENPFEGLANDVPISSMARGIERDIRQMIDQSELPPARKPEGQLLW